MKRTIALLLGLLLCTAVLTAAGNETLISRSYLEGEFSRSLETAVNARLDASDAVIRAGAGAPLPSAAEPPGVTEQTLKEGDILSGPTGLTVTVLGGEVYAGGGTVVDVTAGSALSGGSLTAGHRYIATDSVDFTVSSPTAVVLYEGGSTLTLSLSPDYYAAACALRSLDLFRGSGTGFGDGFDLHLAPTRGEGLVMFLRILGEEQQALACTDSHPFQDVPAWLDRYVAWAYARGYANGVAAGKFGSDQTISAVEYVEFLLRAMDYSVAGVDNYATSLERALTKNVLNQAEYVMLKDTAFLRAHVAYVSYCALDVPVGGESQALAGGQTLAQRLIEAGAMTEAQFYAAQEQTGDIRLH